MPVYEEYYAHRAKGPDRMSAVIPWRSMLAPGVLLQRPPRAQRSYAVRGPDVMGESPEVQGALMLQANEALKRLGGRWMLQSEAQRQRVTTLPEVAWPFPVLTLLDQERRRRLLEDPGSRETRYYMTLSLVATNGGDAAGAAAPGVGGTARGGAADGPGWRRAWRGAAPLPARICPGSRLFHWISLKVSPTA